MKTMGTENPRGYLDRSHMYQVTSEMTELIKCSLELHQLICVTAATTKLN